MTEKKHLINEKRRTFIKKKKNKRNTYQEIIRNCYFNKTLAAIFKIVAAYKNHERVSAAKLEHPKVTNVRIEKRLLNISSSNLFLSFTENTFKIIT